MTIGLLARRLICMKAVVFLIFFVSRPAALPPQKGQTRLRAMSIGKALETTLRAAPRAAATGSTAAGFHPISTGEPAFLFRRPPCRRKPPPSFGTNEHG